MSQDINTMTKRPRRTRVPRNRPVLVTDTTAVESEATTESETPSTSTLAATQTPITDNLAHDTERLTPDTANTPAKPAKRLPRLPNFFSSVVKGEQESTPSQEEVVEARMARVHKNAATQTEQTETAKTKAETKPATKPATRAQAAAARPKLFKPRHFLGLAAYLLAAQFILPGERTLSIYLGTEKVLFTIPGMNVPVETSFLLNIATLILLLYALVALDFLPSGKKYALEQNQNQKGKAASTPGQQNPRQMPASVRPGQQGEDDDLYKNYRLNQRKKK
jgi:hypothetical protein